MLLTSCLVHQHKASDHAWLWSPFPEPPWLGVWLMSTTPCILVVRARVCVFIGRNKLSLITNPNSPLIGRSIRFVLDFHVIMGYIYIYPNLETFSFAAKFLFLCIFAIHSPCTAIGEIPTDWSILDTICPTTNCIPWPWFSPIWIIPPSSTVLATFEWWQSHELHDHRNHPSHKECVAPHSPHYTN